MTITYGELKSQVRSLMDEYSSRGTLLPTTKVADLLNKISFFVNPILFDLANTTGKLAAVKTTPLNPVYNSTSQDTSSIKQHLPGTDFSITLTNALSCFFECIGPATVVIEQSADSGVTYTAIETISIASSVVEFTEYRRLITPGASTNVIRLRFTGSYVYSFRNYVLYPYTWTTAADVQQHRPWFIFDLPTNWLTKNRIMVRKDTRQYVPLSSGDYSISEDKKFNVNRFIAPADIQILYWRKPTLIVPATVADSDILDTTDEAAQVMYLGVASLALISEKDETAGIVARNDYELKKTFLTGNDGSYSGSIVSAMEW
ncbi:MAG: hypothetical protein ACYC4H_00800 [Desulfocucumaceae bacterium]